MPPSPNRRQLLHVLIVEDERISRHALATLLRHSGYVTQEAGSAEEAIGILSRAGGKPEFAIIDVDLPGMNGVDLADYFTSHAPSIHSVLVTASDMERLTRLLESHAPLPLLQKPVNFTQLLHLLETDRDKLAH